MIELAILSDTHLPSGERAIPESCLRRCRQADAILHAGDLCAPSVLDLLRSLGPPVHAICGNVDGPALHGLLPERLELDFGGVRIGMIHAPGPAADRLERLRLSFPGCGAVVFGHTHMPEHEQRGRFQIFNPGSPTARRRSPAHTMGAGRVVHGELSLQLLLV